MLFLNVQFQPHSGGTYKLILNVTGLIISFLNKRFYSGFYHQGVAGGKSGSDYHHSRRQ